MKPRIIIVYKTEGGDVSVARRRNIPKGKWINVTPLEDIIQMIEDKIDNCKNQIKYDKENAKKLGCKHTVKVLNLMLKTLKESK